MTKRDGRQEQIDTVLRRADLAAARRVQRRGSESQKAIREAVESGAALGREDERREEELLAMAAASVIWAIGRKWMGPVDEHGILEQSVDRLRATLDRYAS